MSEQHLLRKLAMIIMIKILLIIGLWWLFVRSHQVTIDSARMAEQLISQQSMTQGKEHHG